MSSSDAHSAQPRVGAAVDSLLAAAHPQPGPSRSRSPPPPAHLTIAEAARNVQYPGELDRADASPAASPRTASGHLPSPPPFPHIANHASPSAEPPSVDSPTLPELSGLPPLGEIMPPPPLFPPITSVPPPPDPREVPSAGVPPSNSEAGSQAVSSSGDEDDEDSEDDQEQQQPLHRRHRWRPLVECKDTPSQDELDHIESKGEHSAEDVEYWEKKTFFDLDDPEIKPGDRGRIDFTVTYNGTKEKPNKERVMNSQVVHIGGYDWRIKFYPRGDDSSYLSCYVECVTMSRAGFDEFHEFPCLPLPRLAAEGGEGKLVKRRSVAAQIGVVMYNPSEPRVNEFQSDAHQYKRRSADYGWQKFSYEYHDTFHQRRFGQRTAILKDDTLAFTAFIRVVRDPTGCLWVHDSKGDPKALYNNSVATTGLRPFVFRGPQLPAMAALLHIPPLRTIIHQTRSDCRAIHLLQTFLTKMMSRKCSEGYGHVQPAEVGDAVSSLQWFAQKVIDGCTADDANLIRNILGTLRPEHGFVVSGNRLKTKGLRSVKDAVLAHPATLPRTTLLTLELQRQEFDSKTRRWRKLTNKVEMDDTIRVGDAEYTLFAYVTHSGGLMSNKHTLYVRPRGVGSLWYGYRDGKVLALTQKQAAGTHCGLDSRKESCKNGRAPLALRHPSDHAKDEVAYVVFYLEAGKGHFEFPDTEEWEDVREVITKANLVSSARGSHGIQSTEDDQEHEPEQDHAVPPSLSGSETPQWRMDGDDVVMSDAEDHVLSSRGDPLAASVQLDGSASAQPSAQPYTVTVDALGQDYYHGDKLGALRHGTGHLITMSGDEYRGEFQQDQPHGQGTMVYAASGSTYTGAWQAGAHHGAGTLREAHGTEYVGGWAHGRKHGAFRLTGTVSDDDRARCNICYARDLDAAFYDCGHVVACHACAAQIDACPVCRKRVLARVQLYGVRVVMD
nr:radial spoke head 1 like [Quercus suber]